MRAACSTLVLALIAFGVASPRSASAQSIPSPYAFIEERQEFGPFAGYMRASTGRFGYGPSGGPLFGARYGVELTGPRSREGGVGVLTGTRDVVNPARPEGDRVIGEADVLLTMIDGRLRLSATGNRTWHGLSPFLVIGGGLAIDSAERSAAEALLDADEIYKFGTKFFTTIGPGVRWFATRRFALRTDAAFSLWQLKTPAGFGDPTLGLENVAESEWVSGLSVTATLLFRW
jgi:hypothetical protein